MLDPNALGALLRRLKQLNYRFRAVTPATHARVLARGKVPHATVRDVFGWSRPFDEGDLEPGLVDMMRAAGCIEETPEGLRSTVRVASLGTDLFLHSRFPTDTRDAVFFGPDTYRFAAFVARRLPLLNRRSVLDFGAGSGAGGIYASRLVPGCDITLVDINPAALDLARINAQAAGVAAHFASNIDDCDLADVIIANPPYVVDAEGRAYRDGGELFGGQVALAWVRGALDILRPGGAVLLYTGAAYVDGEAPLLSALSALCEGASASLEIEEIDPDVFGEELERPAYAQVERIAAVGAVVRPML